MENKQRSAAYAMDLCFIDCDKVLVKNLFAGIMIIV